MVKKQRSSNAGGGNDGSSKLDGAKLHRPRVRRYKSTMMPFERRRLRRLLLSSRSQALRMQEQSEAEASGSKSGNDDGGGEAAGGLAPGPSGCDRGSGATTPNVQNGSEEFLSTGRTGRRNAMPDILGEHAETGTADLPDKFSNLSTDPGGTPSQDQAGPSTQQQHAG